MFAQRLAGLAELIDEAEKRQDIRVEECDRRQSAVIDAIHSEMAILKEFDTHRFVERAEAVKDLGSRLDGVIAGNDLRYQQRHEAQTAAVAEVDKRSQQRFDAQQQAVQDALLAQEKAVNAALTAADRAVAKAEAAAERRFDSVNEFRSTLSDQATTLMPRGEAEAKLTSLNDRLIEVSRLTERNEGKGMGQGIIMVYIFGGLAAIAGLASVIVGIVK